VKELNMVKPRTRTEYRRLVARFIKYVKAPWKEEKLHSKPMRSWPPTPLVVMSFCFNGINSLKEVGAFLAAWGRVCGTVGYCMAHNEARDVKAEWRNKHGAVRKAGDQYGGTHVHKPNPHTVHTKEFLAEFQGAMVKREKDPRPRLAWALLYDGALRAQDLLRIEWEGL
jgi:hypothetical protein